LSFYVCLLQTANSEHTLRAQRLQTQQSYDKTKVGHTQPTLRQWFSQGTFHVAVAPMLSAQLLLSSMLDTLESQGVAGRFISSLSGSSTGGLVASLWATRQTKFATEYVKTFGKSRVGCSTNCSTNTLLYIGLLDLPTASLGARSVECSPFVNLAGLGVPFVTPPLPKESLLLWANYLLQMELLGVPQQFEDLKMPIALAAFNIRKGNHGTTILMSQGNLHIANLAGNSPAHIAKGVVVGRFGAQSAQLKAGDGYPADPFGVLGYDTLVLDQSNYNSVSQRIVNLVPVDSKEQSKGEMNWTTLKRHNLVTQTLSIFLSFDNLFLYTLASKSADVHLPHMKNRNYVWAIQKSLEEALDQKINLLGRSDHIRSYKILISLLPFLNLGAEERDISKAIGRSLADRGGGYYSAVVENIFSIKADDSSGLLQNKQLLTMKRCLARISDSPQRTL